jgi:arabinan endo-1,5-alpha-L-arabinosidase
MRFYLIVLTILISFGVTLAQDATPEPGTYTNPVFDIDFPDPDVLQVEDVYYAYATNTEPYNIQVSSSTDLVNWTPVSEALPELPDWARDEFGFVWAPDVSETEDGYLMYFVARYRIGEGGTQCIGAAVSDSPEGPFEPVGDEPFICQVDEGGSIDPATYIDTDGQRYVLWKNDGNSGGGITWLYIQPVSDDGLTLEGEPTQLIKADKAWEGILVEAPTLWKHDEQYYLFYSANAYYSPSYGVGYAVADDILGPYEKPSSDPLLETSIREGIVGPGGQDIVLDEDGDTWMLFHMWRGGNGYRAMGLVELTWEEGVPVVKPTRAAMDAPEN